MAAGRLAVTSIVIAALVAGACSSERGNSDVTDGEATSSPSTTSTDGLPALSAPPTATSVPTTAAGPPTTRPRRTTTTTTTTLVPVRSAHNPKCVVRVREGDSLFAIAEAADNPAVTITSLQRENRIKDPDRIDVGDLLDICVRNKINDITGKKRVPLARPPGRRSG